MPRVRSFDLFDTLVARRSGDPMAVFDAVGRRFGIADFATLRRDAERRVGRPRYGLADIYAALGEAHGFPAPLLARLREAELAVERAELFPIAETLARVRPGDLIVSDMYLPDEFLREVVRDVCGLPHNPLYLSNRGKWSGAAWRDLRRHYDITRHTGDNPEADCASAARAGIPFARFDGAAPSAIEGVVADAGFPGLARAMRETRLRTWHADPVARAAQLGQAQANLPLLFLASIDLVRHARAVAAAHLLLSSRDCFLWAAMLRRLAPLLGFAGEVSYFYTSRVARVGASVGYLAYLRGFTGRRCVIVDLCGTGWSLSRLLERAGDADTSVFLLRRIHDPRLRREREAVAAVGREAPVAWAIEAEGSSVPIELLNATDHGMTRDVAEIAGGFFPLLDTPVAAEGASALIAAQAAAFDTGLAALAAADLSADRLADDAARHALIRRLHDTLPGHAGALAPLARRLDAEDARMEAAFRAGPLDPAAPITTLRRATRGLRAGWALARGRHRAASGGRTRS